MLDIDTFTRNLERQIEADYEANRAAGRPLFGVADANREARTLTKLARQRLTPWNVLTGQQAAKCSGIAASTLLRLGKQGDGPPYVRTNDGTELYPAGELIFWIEGADLETAKGL